MTTSAPSGSIPPLLGECVPELRAYIARHRASVAAEIGRLEDGGVGAGERYAKVYDGLLCSMLRAVQATTECADSWQPVSLAAVGSYGRGPLALHSDLDVRLLCETGSDLASAAAEALLLPLWDAGLQIGHQVATVDELIQLAYDDLPTATSLLDWRPVAGEPRLSDRLLGRAHEGVFGVASLAEFLDKLEARARERDERFGGSVYLLEPDLKNSPGGLRDLDVAHWAVRARFKVRRLSELVPLGILLPREWQPVNEASAWMCRVRNLLHLEAGRRSDRLSFERQELLAERLGYGRGGPAVERFMSDHYRHARVVSRAREMFLARAMPPPRRRSPGKPIGRGLKVTDGALGLVDPRALEEVPALALRLYAESTRRGLAISADARDSVARAASSPDFAEALRASAEAQDLFRRLLVSVQKSAMHGSVLKELHNLGILVALLPEFAPVIGRVHHDVYHVLTVDAHSVAAVEQLKRLCRGDLAHEHPLASRLAADLARPEVLFFATLLHDVGKDVGGKDHSTRGAELAGKVLERFGLGADEIRAVQHLVQKHLRMYHVATRRDIDDPKTLASFCAEVLGPEGLRELYLLTLADVSTTSPTALTPWKARMLEDLYVAAERYFADGGDERGEAHAETIRQRVRAEGRATGEREFLDYFLGAVSERYLYANDVATILRHSRFARQAQAQFVNVVALAVRGPYVEVGFVADDRPGLLADITATLAAARLTVAGAQVYSFIDAFGRHRALDLFWVSGGSDPGRVLQVLPRVERDFARLVSREINGHELVKAGTAGLAPRNRRPAPRLGTTVTIDNRAATEHTLIEVITEDRPNLLFELASALQRAGLSVALAKINTEGNRVADVFYVSTAAGERATDEAELERLRGDILGAISRMEREANES